MAGLAVLLREAGADVSGCDAHPGPRTRWLESLGIPVVGVHDPMHAADADEVVVTPAVPRDSPEFAAAFAAGKVRFRGEVLAELANAADTVAVCGSHGKTTTATWTAKLLLTLGEDVAWCIGGETGEFPVARAGMGPLVIEADESDGTLALYRAKTLVVTNCDYDHPDHFPDKAAYVACFDAARRAAADVVEAESLPDEPAFAAALAPLAAHNRRNARAAAEVALRRGHSAEAVAAALPGVVAELPDRRFQKLADGVYADYAHHPTEIACAVAMARAECHGTLRVLFQPHRYSRTKALLDGFASSFGGVDELVVCPTYAAFEKPIPGGDSADLYAALRERRRAGTYLARTCAEAWEHVRNTAEEGDVALILGAGDIIALAPTVREDVARRAAGAPPPRRRIFAGACSNTWKSDLALSVDYVRTSGPAGMPGAELLKAHPRLMPWMAGIPGTVGGWIKMNAGAFGHSFSEVLEKVEVDGEWIAAANCGFGYRTSAINGEIRDFSLVPDPPVEAAVASPEEYLARRAKFPPGTYGSFFKNPPGDSAGRLLDEAGAKGLRVGGAYVWSGHANVIVRGEGATASDVLALARLMRNLVYFRTGVSLEPEVCGVVVG